MPDYSLGRAHGQIDIDYDGTGADKAAAGLGKVAAAATAADQSLDKTQKTLGDNEKAMDSAGSSAEGYHRRLKDVESASHDVDSAEKSLRSTLLDTRATLDDVKDAEDRVSEAKKRHVQASNAARDAHKAYSSELNTGQRAVSALAGILPNLHANLDRLATVSDSAGQKASGLSGKLSGLAKVVGFLGPEGKAAAAGLLLVSKGMDSVGGSASASTGFISGLVAQIASFEVGFGKIAGLTLGVTALGGLAGLGGAAGVQGIVEMAGAAQQLSGVLGLLPSVISAVEFSSQTLQVAFHGVSDALTDMMAKDPKKFLEDIKDMGPVAAQAMLTVAGFRDQFRMAGGAIQDSFFKQIAADIAPLIQTWLPAIAQGMSGIAAIFGQAADQFAKLLQQPAAMQAFQAFVTNLGAGLQALIPAMAPLLTIFTQLTVTGSSLFGQLGDRIVQVVNFFGDLINKAAASGQLQAWITDGINAFGHLLNIAYSVSSAFLTIMDVADKFGGGGLLAWLEQVAQQLNMWTQSADGQKALTDFFSVLRTATDAFTPMLKPLVEGLASIGTAFTQLGVASAPGFQEFFTTFAKTMEMLGPQIVGMGPAINTFLTGMAFSFGQLVATLGPQLPRIFQDLANAMIPLMAQIPALSVVFVQLAEQVGPQMPKFFGAVTNLIIALLPYLPIITGLIRDFVSILTVLIEAGAGVVNFFTTWLGKLSEFVQKVPGAFNAVGNAIRDALDGLSKWGEDAGTKLIDGIVKGIKNGLGAIGRAAKSVVDEVSSWFPQSPAKQGPFSGAGYTYVRGQKMVTDMAAGIVSEQGTIAAAAASTAAAASGALSSGGAATGGSGGAPSPGGASTTGNSLLPDNIAGADTSILTAYLRHQFDDNRGLKGLAKDLGNVLAVAQSGFNLINTYGVQPIFKALGMVPGSGEKTWHKMTPKEIESQQQADMQKTSVKDDKPNWQDVLGPGVSPGGGGGGQVPLGLSGSSSKADIQKAIIAAGRARGMNDGAIQTALAVAAAESGFNPTISGGVQGSAGEVSGLFQQSPSSGWGTMAQVNDPNFAINAFYDAYAKNLAKNPTNPQLAAVLTQNPQLGSGAQGSDYWNAVGAKLGEANSIMGAYGKNTTGLAWGPGGSISMPPTAGLPPGGGGPLFTGEGPDQYQAAFAHNSAFAKPSTTDYQTQLDPATEKQFRDWVAKNNVPFAPNDKTTDYDMRGYYQAMMQGNAPKWSGADSHFPDTFKTPYDTTFSAESQYATPDNPFKWQGDNLVDSRTGALVFGTPTQGASGAGITANPASRASTLGGANANYTPETMAAAGIAPLFTKSAPGSMTGAPAWVSQLASAFGLTATSHQDTTLHGGTGQMGDWAFDFSGGVPDMQKFADYIKTNLASQTLQAIWQNPQSGQQLGIAGGQVLGPGQYYTTAGGTYADHMDHVHWATDVAPLGLPGGPTPLSARTAGVGAGAGTGGLILPSGQSLDALTATATQNTSINDKLLQSYLQGNPALAQQINAAQTPGAPDQTVMDSLTGINKTITTLQTQDAVGNKNTIEALQGAQTKIAAQQGFASGPSALSQAQGIAGGVTSGIGEVFKAISSGLDALTATQDIADRLVYGVRNTEDISKIIDDVQKYITYAADILSAAGSITSMVGSFTGGADFGGTSAAGSMLSMIAGVLQGVNAAIDFGQQVYEITMGYVGKFMSVLTGLGGTDLMGNVGFLLNKNTGQLLSYSHDNPEAKNAANVPSWMNSWYDYNGKGNPNPQVNQQLNVYAGPGQSPAAMMNETMWLVNTQGTTGALQPANF